eukprot:scaffold2510_cov169-Amphora_coffeaeformis.AAC.57
MRAKSWLPPRTSSVERPPDARGSADGSAHHTFPKQQGTRCHSSPHFVHYMMSRTIFGMLFLIFATTETGGGGFARRMVRGRRPTRCR